MFHKNTANKRNTEIWFLAVSTLMLLLLFAWFAWQSQISKWTLLEKNNLASVHIEQSLYESSGSNRFFIRFRITNETQKLLAVNLKDNQGTWGMVYAYQWTLAEGDHRGCVNGLIQIPPMDDIRRRETKLLADYKAGNLTIIPPAGVVDFYRESAFGGRADINKGWASAPFWVRSKSFIPRAPSPVHFIAIVRGSMLLTDGKIVKSFIKTGTEIGIPFPLHWKQIPSKGEVVTCETTS